MLRAPILGSTILLLSLLAPIAAVNAATQTITFNKSITENNLTITVSGTITVDTTAQTISGIITITVINNTSGQTIFSMTFPFSHSIATSHAFVQTIPTPFITMAASCNSTGCMVSNNPDIAHQGTVNIVDVATVAQSFGSNKGDPNYNPAADLDGNGRVDIMDVSIVAFDFGLPVY